jgi:hypothetical protein
VLNVHTKLADKRDIVQTAIELLQALGRDCPKVAILSAQEQIDPGIESTLEAAALCKMAERGQISGGMVDGPLAFDTAVARVPIVLSDPDDPPRERSAGCALALLAVQAKKAGGKGAGSGPVVRLR